MLNRPSVSAARSSRPGRSGAGLLALVISLLTLAAMLMPSSALGAAAPVDPSKDAPDLPVRCGGGGEFLMPQNKGVCPLKSFHRSWPTVMVWGDSHGWEFTPALRRLTKGLNVNLVAFARGGCPPMKAADPTRESHLSCVVSNNDALAYVKKLAARPHKLQVILSANWVTYRNAWIRDEQGQPQPPGQEPYVQKMAALAKDGIPRLMSALGRMSNVKVDVVSSVLRVPDPAAPCPQGDNPYSCDIARAQAIPDENSTKNWLQSTMAPLKKGSRLIDVNSYFCDDALLFPQCHGMVKSVHTFYDDLHISATASKKLSGYFAASIPASS
jgi:hypothetical protein